MKQLVILSGKGGTGKTSITGAFAALADNAVLVDCDVDAADLHLIVGPEIMERHDFSASEKAEIIQDMCIRCGICYECCEFDAIIRDESSPDTPLAVYRVDPMSCEGCAVCSHVCLDNAVAMKPVVSGEWYRSETRFGPMVHGRLGIAETNSGKLVTLLRAEARRIADDQNRDLIIIDGPPGIGCPAIASLTGADYVLLVTEPTLSALHDLGRVAELIRHFNLSAGICINKCDINTSVADQVVGFAESQGFQILGRLPYDIVMTKAQVAGKTIIEYTDTEISRHLRSLWTNVRRCLDNIESPRPIGVRVNTNNPNSFGV
jgi:MinD superfamily P-loop ATPase